MNVVIHRGALGDWVVTFPLLAGLAPEPVTVVAAASKTRLAARLLPHITAVDIEAHGFFRLHLPELETTAKVKQLFARAKRVISFVSSGHDTWAANVRQLVSVDTKLYFIDPRPPATWRGHVSEWHLAQLSEQGWRNDSKPEDEVRRILGPQSDESQANDPDDSPSLIIGLGVARLSPRTADMPIIIHPGSGGREKCWPIDRFEMLIARLREAGHRVRPLLGEVELHRWRPEVVERWRSELGAVLLDSLDQLCDELCAARLFIGNDSGPTHLAAWLGVPTIALFGPSDATHWSPRGRDVTVLISETRTMEGLRFDDVWQRLHSPPS